MERLGPKENVESRIVGKAMRRRQFGYKMIRSHENMSVGWTWFR